MKSKHYLHGGDLDAAAQLYGINRNEIWDFSGNINPFGISPKARLALQEQVDLISTYPDRNYTYLKQAISNYCQISTEHILVGNGSTELISTTIHFIHPKKALILGPTYSEYEREISLIKGTCDYFPLKEEDDFALDISSFLDTMTKDYDMIILCNPNNPTSTALSSQTLAKILEIAKIHHAFVMIDETYIEFCDNPNDYSAVSLINSFDNLLVLRGISKFFASPGLRFGYGICSNQALKKHLLHTQKPWSINTLACVGAQVMLSDTDYIKTTHQLIVNERKRLISKLLTIDNLKVFIPSANFILLKVLNTNFSANCLVDYLMNKGMLIRDASSFPFLNEQFIRFCFLKPEQNDLLIKEIDYFLYKNTQSL